MTSFTSFSGSFQAKMKKRGPKTMINLGRHFRKLDKSGDGNLGKSELKDALKEFRLEIPEEVSLPSVNSFHKIIEI